MMLLVLLMIGLGVLLGRSLKVVSLVPATFIAWIAAAHFAHIAAFSFAQTLAIAVLCGACLQLGYLAGAMLSGLRLMQPKNAVGAVRR